MAVHARAGSPATSADLIDLAALERAYYEIRPDGKDPRQRVSFGTSGHRGTSASGTFNEQHILAISQAICEYRKHKGITGPLFMGQDTHALSLAAQRTALEVLAAHEVEVFLQANGGYTPTPVISHAILNYNAGRDSGLADGIVITPSHNPPQDGGFKYNPPNGGPAEAEITGWIEQRANELLAAHGAGVRRIEYERAYTAPTTHHHDFAPAFIDDLASVIDMEMIRASGLRIGVDPLGGASATYWQPVAERYALNLKVVNTAIDPTFRFMTLDHDGMIRMDCSSRYAMAGLVGLKDDFDIAFGNDPDADRHGIVTRSHGLLNPNHFLCVAIEYLAGRRSGWPAAARIGKTLVSSGLIDRVAASLKREVYEVPVGFKWFAPGLFDGTVCFGGEESAGASFLRRNGKVWTTDKDGLILGLLAAEMTAACERDPGELYEAITHRFGPSFYVRRDNKATPELKKKLKELSPSNVTATTVAGDPVEAVLTAAPGNGEPIGGLKVVTQNGWFAARPSGTEDLYKLYAESFRDDDHLFELVEEANAIVQQVA